MDSGHESDNNSEAKPLEANYNEFIPTWNSETYSPELSALAALTDVRQLVGLQKRIVLRGESHAELVKALRIHPKYEGRSVRDLLSFVRRNIEDDGSLELKLSKKLIPIYSAVIKSEGIVVSVQ